MSFSDINYYKYKYNQDDYNLSKKENNCSRIGTITFGINKSYCDIYKRTYQRIQSLLAEIMRVINLLFEIRRKLSFFFFEKKMSKDIIRNLIYNKKNIIGKNNKNKIFKTDEKREISSSERKNLGSILINK